MKATSVKPVRCAIYTRVSTDQGLDQEFNSLDAQYDASSAYIKSQAHAGWTLIKTRYDDGGYSDGSTDRPDLQRLLDDIRARKIDVIVVYKVDRLTRSLVDFAKLVEQAVIAIQNVRMFDEVQARTRDLTEALQQQTATADVLKVISRSTFDLNMVTTAILQAAAQLCRAPLATLHLRDGDVCRLVTQFGLCPRRLNKSAATILSRLVTPCTRAAKCAPANSHNSRTPRAIQIIYTKRWQNWVVIVLSSSSR
jgi:predicted site-specific integrase-resolvase